MSGGGIYTGIKHWFCPSLMCNRSENAELITVRMEGKYNGLRIVLVYGPQGKDTEENREAFYEDLSVEIERCLLSGDSLFLAGDFSAKLDSEIINYDTHTMSRNGKLLHDLIQKYNLYLLNSSKVCSGVFTRTPQCNGKQEISVLDYVFVTSDISVRSIEHDEKNFFTPWRKLRKGRRFSDHHAIKLSLNLDFNKFPKRAKTLVVRNFDDPLNWKSFHQRTKLSDDLQKSWKIKNNVEACYKQ